MTVLMKVSMNDLCRYGKDEQSQEEEVDGAFCSSFINWPNRNPLGDLCNCLSGLLGLSVYH